MKHCILRRALCDSKTIDRYLAHLSPAAGKEVVPLVDILPNPRDPPEELVKFHTLLRSRMESEGNSIIGIQVQPANSEAIKVLRGTTTICWPLYKKDLVGHSSSIKRQSLRVQNIESGICLRLNERQKIEFFAPAVVATGSRYTFFAPHSVGLAADRGGMVAFAHDQWRPWTDDAAAASHVLSRNGEPIRIGSTRFIFEDIDRELQFAVDFARQIGYSLAESSVVLLTGTHSRASATDGSYDVHYGPLGEVACSIVSN